MSSDNVVRERLFRGALQALDNTFSCVFRKHAGSTESPIEAALLESLIFYDWCSNGQMTNVNGDPGNSCWHVTTQARIDEYRVDFLLICTVWNVSVVIECDGHEFHERTKEQAQRDRSRDRTLQAMGYLVLRFTGSEIWRDPWGCAEQIAGSIYQYAYKRGCA